MLMPRVIQIINGMHRKFPVLLLYIVIAEHAHDT
jgi:hypothetical protein